MNVPLSPVPDLDGGFRRKDLLGLADLTREEILYLLHTAVRFKEISEREIKKVPTLRGKSVVHLFMEPSTRTKTSFDVAAKRLSADTFAVGGSSSATSKGETLIDTARNIEAMRPDILVLRHRHPGSAALLARLLDCGVINAGDGSHEHPTQALLDIMTIRERLGSIEGRSVCIVGDIAHSRVVRSNIHGLRKLGAQVRVCGPPTMIPAGVDRLGVEVHEDLRTAIDGVDVIMMLRIQMERMGRRGQLFPSEREYANRWGLNLQTMQYAREDVLVMHPGPINRGVEMAPEVADGRWSVILEQVTNGVAVRMAVMYLLTPQGGNRAADHR
jgi:aspartate carbamoyltransferase catalytic subunit